MKKSLWKSLMLPTKLELVSEPSSNKLISYLENTRRTVKIMDIFDWNDIEERKLSPLQPMLTCVEWKYNTQFP